MKIFDIAIKDLIRSSRSLFLLGMTVAAPLLITVLIYFAFSGIIKGDVSLTPINMGVVDQDVLPANSTLTAPLGSSIESIFFDASVKSWITASHYSSETDARDAINARAIQVAVIIPADFTNNYLAGNNQSPITILQDPTLKVSPFVVQSMVSSALDGVAGGSVAFQTISARMQAIAKTLDPASISTILNDYINWYSDYQRKLFHTPDLAALVVKTPAAGGSSSSAIQNIMGTVMAGQIIFFSFFSGSYAMMSILQEDEEGTLARLFTTPTNKTIILAGKFLAVFLTVLIQGVVMLILGSLLFGIQWGAPGSLLLALVGQMFASVGLAVLLVSFIKTTKQAGPIFGGALTALGMVSGLFTTNIAMPEAFNTLANFTPQGWVLKAWKLSLAGQPAQQLLVPFLALVAMGVVMFVIGAVMFRRRYA